MGWFVFPEVGGSAIAPVFEFDATTGEEDTLEIDWTDAPVENKGDLAEHGWTKPQTLIVTGLKSAMNLQALQLGSNIDTLMGAYEALKLLAKQKQQVTVVGRFVETRVITRVSGKVDVAIGEALDITVELQEVELPIPSTVQIPASRLRRKVRRRGPGKTGGATAPLTGADFNAQTPRYTQSPRGPMALSDDSFRTVQ